MKLPDWSDGKVAALRARIKAPDVLQAFDVLVAYGIAAPHFEAGPGAHGYMTDFRFKSSADWPFSFTCNQEHLLFYLRPAGVRGLRATPALLTQWFDEVKVRRDGELTVKVRTEADAARVISEILETWSSAEGGNPRSLTAQETLIADVDTIRHSPVDATVRESLIEARIGQGRFRANVLALWGSQCAVTGSSTLHAVRASHIKAWCDSDNVERLDPYNGLPLLATLDALFDAGLISFAEDGGMLVSSRLSSAERELLGLDGPRLVREPSSETAEYLAWHRDKIFAE